MAVPSATDLPESIPIEPSDWSYKAEGNQSIVLSYRGSDTNICGWLLRLSKCDVAAGTNANADACATHRHDDTQRKRDDATFATSVIGPLLGAEYVLPQRLVALKPESLRQLHEKCEPLRPAHRLHRQIDLAQGVGILQPNAFRGTPPGSSRLRQSVTVELKPKWGFLPSSASISPHNSVKSRVCRYCMHQYTKHASQDVSGFCPLDLYSGDRRRIVRALDSLARSPQNNLRVFVGDHSVIDKQGKISDECVPQWEALRDCVADIILKEPLFSRLKRCQQALDSLDIEGVLPLYRRAMESGSLANAQPSINDWLSAVSDFLRRSGNADSPATDKQAILEFLISTTLKDVSVLITLPEWPIHKTAPGGMSSEPQYAVAVIDSDPKQLAKIPDYFSKDEKIVKHFLKHCPDPGSRPRCSE
ncbi:hypothetical protein GGI18_000170 [Coemansia linderi]|uniref:Uncharacterized protein n=1 Tax=Coemansia linderi TaxID=2663919 RepID=A0ACC1KQ52_9FUNG|nr:hypothetical protein GGI18_000170 [Coemansia linderi]